MHELQGCSISDFYAYELEISEYPSADLRRFFSLCDDMLTVT